MLRGAACLLEGRHIMWQIEIDVALLRERGFGAGDLFTIMRQHFTHFVDLNRFARGACVKLVAELTSGLAYLHHGNGGRTDVLAFTLSTQT